jgi:hypothetical protein
MRFPIKRPKQGSEKVLRTSRAGTGRLARWQLAPALSKDSNAPILYVDRLEYVEAIDQAIHGLETARLAMVKACRQMEESPKGF